MDTPSRTGWVAWTLVGLSVAIWAATGYLWRAIDMAGVPTPGGDSVALLAEVCVAVLVIAVVGAVVASRRPRHPIGWIFVGVAFVVSVKSITGMYVQYAYYLGAELPLRREVAWLSNWMWVAAVGTYATFLLLLFPTGRPPTRRWRIVGWLAVTAIAVASAGTALVPGPLDQFAYVENPLAVPRAAAPVVDAVGGAGFALLLLSIALSVASLVARARRAGATERAQIRWIGFAGALLLPGFAFTLGTESFDARSAPLVFGPIAGIAVAAALAIQRYRLFEIDRLISRTLSYAVVTALLAGLYVLVVLVPTNRLGAGSERPDWLVAVGTLVVAAVFSPVRRSVQTAVDHRFNRRRFDAEHTVAAFTSRLREQVDLDELRGELRQVVTRTMSPSHMSLWVRNESGTPMGLDGRKP